MRKDSLGIAKQVDLATEQTVMEYFPPVTDVTCAPQRQTMTVEETTGTPFPTGLEYGTEWWQVNAKGAARYASLPRLLSAYLGAPVTTTPDNVGAPTGRKHAFAAANAPVPHSLLVSRVDPNPAIIDLAFGAIGDALTVSVDPNGYLMYDATLAALGNDQARPAPVVTLDQSQRVKFYEVVAFISVNGGAETAFKCAGFSAAYSNNIDTDEAILGSQSLYTVSDQNKDLELNFTVRDNLNQQYRRNLQATPDSVKIRLLATGALIGGAVNFSVELITYASEYIDAQAAVSASSRLKSIPIKARAKLDPTTGKFFEVNVQNAVAAGY
jgi:hypothetical protein